MKKYEWSLSIGLAGAKQGGIIELNDDLTEEEVEIIIRDEVFDNIDWGYAEVPKEDNNER